MFEELHLDETARFLRERVRGDVEVALILGSGLQALGGRVEAEARIPYGEIPGLPSALVPGHLGVLTAGSLEGRRAAVFAGRFHLYQGLPAAHVLWPVLLARALGARFLIATCAAGGVDPRLEAGDIFLIEDQVNLMGFDPTALIPEPEREPRFLAMAGAYDPEILEKNAETAFIMGLGFGRGVLAGVRGPCYETRAEVRWLRSIGAGAVSMSVIPEVILARYFGMTVAGVALIANRAADHSRKAITHEDVLSTAAIRAEEFSELLARIVKALPAAGRAEPGGRVS